MKNEIKNLILVLNSSNNLFKYPIGNRTLTDKIKLLESQNKIIFDDKINKWNEVKKTK